jgi:hypothetical protein
MQKQKQYRNPGLTGYLYSKGEMMQLAALVKNMIYFF